MVQDYFTGRTAFLIVTNQYQSTQRKTFKNFTYSFLIINRIYLKLTNINAQGSQSQNIARPKLA